MVKASSYRQSTVKSGINVVSEEKNEANNCTEYIFILWNVASNISHHPFISAYTGGKKKSTGKKTESSSHILRIKRNHTIKMKESTHNQIMISSLLYFITILPSFLHINCNECESAKVGEVKKRRRRRRLGTNEKRTGPKTYRNQIYIAAIFHRFALFIPLSPSLALSSYWLLFDFKGESINRHKLFCTNISNMLDVRCRRRRRCRLCSNIISMSN